MSKAFVKNEDVQETNPSFKRSLVGLNQNYLTVAGHQKFTAELEDLLHQDTRSPQLDARIQELSLLLESAQVIDPEAQPKDRVLFGATVTVQDEDELIKKYQIVGVEEANVSQGKISWICPLAKALLQAQVGDLVRVKLPQKEEELEVLEIGYENKPSYQN